MRKALGFSFHLVVGLVTTCSLVAKADGVGPWPLSQPYLWSTNPFAPVGGVVLLEQPGTVDNLVMGNLGTGGKNSWWLPYGSLNDVAWQERMCMAQLSLPPNTPVTNLHVKVLDQATVGKHGWAIIFKDSESRILDFGVRPHFSRGYFAPHEWDGTNWVTWVSGSTFTPQYERPRHGADYYTMDFTQNGDGTITWVVEGFDGSSMTAFLSPTTNTTTVAYGPITEVHLNASTTDTTTQNYKWTEFSALPQVYSPPTLNMTPSSGDLLFSWRSPWNNFLLQANPDLNTITWTNVPDSTSDDGTNITVTIPIGPGNLFYRLSN